MLKNLITTKHGFETAESGSSHMKKLNAKIQNRESAIMNKKEKS